MNKSIIPATFFAAMSFVSESAVAAVTFYDSKAAFDAAASTTLIEDFTSFAPKDTNIFSSITRGIATYTPFAPIHAPNLVVTGVPYTNFGANLNPVTEHVLTTSGDEDILVTFATGLTAVGFNGYLNGLGPGTVSVFNGSTLLDTLNLDNPVGGALIYVGITSSTPITAFRWITTDGGILNTAIDNISVSAVPEPATYATLLTGLGLLGFNRWRRRMD